ncbi:MAG: FAD-binding PCMH-type protein [Dehalococcoidia bacterium]|nr:FAD-binding PCMH-type protein [Dehalococcoidia bacterium]
MQDFEYVAPTTLEEAVRLLDGNGLKVKALAGGTDILVQLRANRFQVDRLVDIKGIPELNQLSCSEADGLTLGAAVPCYRVYEDERIARLYPALVDATSLIGSIQVQSRGTVGGNLCNAAPSGDSIPALIILGATCEIAGPKGRRTVQVERFCTGPGRNVLEPGEMLVSLKLPLPKANSGAHFLRFTPRKEMDIAVVGVGASVLLDDARQRILSARIALGAVAPTPLLAREAGDLLAGREASEAAIEEAAKAARAAARPITDIRGTARQRTHLVGVLTKRALGTAIARAKEGKKP